MRPFTKVKLLHDDGTETELHVSSYNINLGRHSGMDVEIKAVGLIPARGMPGMVVGSPVAVPAQRSHGAQFKVGDSVLGSRQASAARHGMIGEVKGTRPNRQTGAPVYEVEWSDRKILQHDEWELDPHTSNSTPMSAIRGAGARIGHPMPYQYKVTSVKDPGPPPAVLSCGCGKEKHGFAKHSDWCDIKE